MSGNLNFIRKTTKNVKYKIKERRLKRDQGTDRSLGAELCLPRLSSVIVYVLFINDTLSYTSTTIFINMGGMVEFRHHNDFSVLQCWACLVKGGSEEVKK